MTLKSVVLHPGAHKTATSLLQKYMRDNPRLCQQAGLAVLRRSDTDRLLRWGRAPDVEAGREELRERIAEAGRDGARHYVISHENAIGRPLTSSGQRLYPHARERAAAVADALADLPVTVIYYIREAAAFLESYYLQTVHEGGTATFDRWYAGLKEPSLSWRPVYDDLCAAFGAANVVIRSFDAEITRGQKGYLRGFFSLFSTPNDLEAFNEFAYGPVRNPSVGDKGLKMALAVNRFTETSAERKLVRHFLQEHFSNQSYARPILLSEEQRTRIGEEYRDDVGEVLASSEAATA